MNNNTAPTRGPHRGYLLEKIGEYLNRNVGVESKDPERVQLLRAVAEYFHLEACKEAVHENLTTPILGTLQTIQDCLNQIKKQDITKPQQHGSYAAAAASGKFVGSAETPKNVISKAMVA